jgi:thiamine biosynthesis lipoprotein
MRLAGRVGVPTPVSAILYEAIAFALAVARASGGAFDPTVGHALERRGFNRHYRTGEVIASRIAPGGRVSYHDVYLDPARRTVTLRRPLVLDLGAVAKGLAVDLAARELAPYPDFAIDAGGDLYVHGRNAAGEPWRVGLRHPRRTDELLATLRQGIIDTPVWQGERRTGEPPATLRQDIPDTPAWQGERQADELQAMLRFAGAAVCTSGDYERRSPGPGGGHHLLDPRSGRPAEAAASVTVVAPTAMAADALGTAAFVLGPQRGLRLLEHQGVEGLIVAPTLEQYATPGFRSYLG